MDKNIWDNKDLVTVLERGGVAVMPTDTIYGMVARALSKDAVNYIYEIRRRAPDKPCIILIGEMSELEKFSVNISEDQKKELQKYWPPDDTEEVRATSIIFDCLDDRFEYLHRGTKTLAFRLPRVAGLRELLIKTGPLIAPSANIEKFPASESIEDARKYFGDKVNLYLDAGPVVSKASRVIRLHPDGTVNILRE